jgi:uncharacterized coiled-coil protein SlyX
MNENNDARIAELEKKVAHLEGWLETLLTITDRGKEFKRIDAQIDLALTLGYNLKGLCKRHFPDDEIFQPLPINPVPRPPRSSDGA